jgi:hypothetical protein
MCDEDALRRRAGVPREVGGDGGKDIIADGLPNPVNHKAPSLRESVLGLRR